MYYAHTVFFKKGENMAYQAIYRKWRPLTFEDVVGQNHITDTLRTELKTNKIAHAYLFCGTRGTGKTTTAKILSRAVNCDHLSPDGNPCNECPSCKGILNGTVMDVTEIDAASNNGVDNIRELRDEVIYSPSESKYKVYIIDEVHMLSKGAFNALLKTLEEPPAHAVFILATTEPHKIPATIRSRCQQFDFRRISKKDIIGRIGEIVRGDNISITPDAISLVAELGDGSMRDALSVLDLCTGAEGEITREYIEDVAGVPSKSILKKVTSCILNFDFNGAILQLTDITDKGMEVNTVIDNIISILRDMLICKTMENPSKVIDESDEEIEKIKQEAKKFSADTIIYNIKTLSEYGVICKTAGNPRAVLDACIVKLCNPESDTSSSAFAARIAKLENMIKSGVTITSAPPVTEKKPVEQAKEATPEADEPPFDMGNEFIGEEASPPEPPPMFDEPAVIIEEEKPKEASKPRNDESYSAFLNLLREENPAAASLLINARKEVRNDVSYFIFEDEFLKDTIAKNEIFVTSVKNVCQTPVKFITENEENGKSEPESDPLDEIIKLSETNNNITII